MYLPIAAHEQSIEISKAYCGDLQSVVVPVLTDSHATPIYIGDTGRGGKIIVLTDDTNHFWVILTNVDDQGNACGLLSGSDWHPADVSPSKPSKPHPRGSP